MRILFYSSYFYPYCSGLTQYPLQVLSYLSSNHKITVVTFPHQPNLSKKSLFGKINIIRIPYLQNISKGYLSPQSLIYFFKYLRSHDILLLNLPNLEALPLVILAKLANKKIIAIYHCRVNLGSSFSSRLIAGILNVGVMIQFYLSDVIISHIDYLNEVKLPVKIKNKLITSLPPIMDYPVNQKQLIKFIKIKKDSIWIGFVGRIAKEKGIETVIEAVSQLKLRQRKIKLVFAGPYGNRVSGEYSYYQKLITLLDRSLIDYRFFGYLDNVDLGAFYKAIDVLILPSVNSTEAFGMVQAEAMKLGTPVIASNLPGVRMPLTLTKMGILVDPYQPRQLMQAINQIIDHKAKYTNQKLTANAKSIFNNNKVFQLYENLINSKIK